MSVSLKKQPMTMKTSGYVTINAAFLQEVKEESWELWESLHRLRDATQQMRAPLSVELNKWVSKLADVRSELATEFSLEETYGYITQVAQPYSGPGRNPAATRLQHAELYLQLSELCEQIEVAQYRGTLMRDFQTYADEFQEFLEALRNHEYEEARLIQFGLGLKM